MINNEYKPLLFTTTVRNPSRFKYYLKILSLFEGKILTNELATCIFGEIIRHGLYRPKNKTPSISEKWQDTPQGYLATTLLSDAEVKWLLENNQQSHKEATYDKGWPSRFATSFAWAKQLGFANIEIGEIIKISQIGKVLLSTFSQSNPLQASYFEIVNPQCETAAFLHAMVKYHRDNPFLRVKNANVPLVLLLRVIKLLNADPKNAGISRKELPLIICWKDDNAQAVYEAIMNIRMKYGFSPSDEVICDFCYEELLGKNFKKFQLASLMNEYPDEFIRKMRLTGLFSIRGAGRFLDIDSRCEKIVDYVLSNYSEYKSYSDCEEYYKYVSAPDPVLLATKEIVTKDKHSEQLLEKWAQNYRWDVIKKELMLLSGRKSSVDPILRILEKPLRLEFLAAIAIKKRRSAYRIVPNYKCDDEGIPTSTASGNKGDIECYGKNNVLVEVTMANGRTQTVMEAWPVMRHLEEFSSNYADASCAFVAPSIYPDTQDQIDWQSQRKSLKATTFTIKQFIDELDIDKIEFGVFG